MAASEPARYARASALVCGAGRCSGICSDASGMSSALVVVAQPTSMLASVPIANSAIAHFVGIRRRYQPARRDAGRVSISQLRHDAPVISTTALLIAIAGATPTNATPTVDE